LRHKTLQCSFLGFTGNFKYLEETSTLRQDQCIASLSQHVLLAERSRSHNSYLKQLYCQITTPEDEW